MKPGEVLAQLGSGDLTTIANALRTRRLAPPFSIAAMGKIAGPYMAKQVVEVLQLLADRGLGAEQMALTLELLVEAMGRMSPVDDIAQLVMTAPTDSGAYHRDTRVVVTDLFRRAQLSVTVAGYAVYQGKKIFEELASRMSAIPSLNVRLLLHAHLDDISSAGTIARFGQKFKAEHWPQDHPLPEVFFDRRGLDSPAGHSVAFHAKCIILDDAEVFISSANFTEAAQNRNIEMGVLLKSPVLAKQASQFFLHLVAEGVCERAL